MNFNNKTPLDMVFEAAMTKNELMQGEQVAQKWGTTRRSVMVFLTKSCAELENSSGELVDTTLAVIESLNAFLEWRKHETELLEAARARMFATIQAYMDALPAET